MNKNIKLAVAGAVLALSATANAGIIIPAGDWTVDLGGNVNAFYTHTQTDTTVNSTGVKTSAVDGNTIGTGLLPAAFGIGAKTRQNDLDVAFQFSFFTGTSSGNNVLSTNGLTYTTGPTDSTVNSAARQSGGAAGNNTLNIRQAFLSFGDKSWGSIKLGRDLGIYGSDAILSDMTLLGVGTGGPAGGSSTLGRIGSGYIYADWKGQISYSSPNFNGFQVSAGVMENFKPSALATTTGAASDKMAYEGKATYDFAANDVTGRIWVSGITQKTNNVGSSYTSKGGDIGAKVSMGPASVVGYYYSGDGLDSQNVLLQGLFNGNGEKSKDSGGYVQGTFVVPGIGTKLGLSWGESNSKAANGTTFDIENRSWIVGAYHPLTKHLNLVAEYTDQEVKDKVAAGSKVDADTVSLGAILFF
jgi:predicted porin